VLLDRSVVLSPLRGGAQIGSIDLQMGRVDCGSILAKSSIARCLAIGIRVEVPADRRVRRLASNQRFGSYPKRRYLLVKSLQIRISWT